MKSFRCPVCNKSLSKKEYEKALGILDEKNQHFQHVKADLLNQLKQAKAKGTEARQAGMSAERKRTQRLLQGKERDIDRLRERLSQLKKGSTPQTEGLEFEETLVARLQREFREDKVQHKGKGGDILHLVFFNGKLAGTIVYECKRCPKILSQHINQTRLAKQTREADFAVMVTTGAKKNFNGLGHTDDVLMVSPLGTIPLAKLLRLHLIEMLRSKISQKERAAIAGEMMKFIASPQFKNPIEEIVQVSNQLQEMIQDEAKTHLKTWKKRWEHYQTIQWDGTQVQANIRLVLHGKQPKSIHHREIIPLQLPAMKS